MFSSLFIVCLFFAIYLVGRWNGRQERNDERDCELSKAKTRAAIAELKLARCQCAQKQADLDEAQLRIHHLQGGQRTLTAGIARHLEVAH